MKRIKLARFVCTLKQTGFLTVDITTTVMARSFAAAVSYFGERLGEGDRIVGIEQTTPFTPIALRDTGVTVADTSL